MLKLIQRLLLALRFCPVKVEIMAYRRGPEQDFRDEVNTYLAKLDEMGVVYQLEWKVDEDDLTAVVTYASEIAIPADISESAEEE